jgi:hypothetical protein
MIVTTLIRDAVSGAKNTISEQKFACLVVVKEVRAITLRKQLGRIRMSINIEPVLGEIMNYFVAIGRSTFAKDATDEASLHNGLLLILAGRGLAEIKIVNGQPVWKAAGQLVERFNQPEKPVDFSVLSESPIDNISAPAMNGSLRIILDAYVDHAKMQREASATSEAIETGTTENAGHDLMLLVLAGSRKARFERIDEGGGFRWIATPALINEFNSEMTGKESEEIRIDSTLSEVAEYWYILSKESAGGVAPPRSGVNFITVQMMEMDGRAIAYRDFDGALAWKASDEFRREWEDDSDE